MQHDARCNELPSRKLTFSHLKIGQNPIRKGSFPSINFLNENVSFREGKLNLYDYKASSNNEQLHVQHILTCTCK